MRVRLKQHEQNHQSPEEAGGDSPGSGQMTSLAMAFRSQAVVLKKKHKKKK